MPWQTSTNVRPVHLTGSHINVIPSFTWTKLSGLPQSVFLSLITVYYEIKWHISDRYDYAHRIFQHRE